MKIRRVRPLCTFHTVERYTKTYFYIPVDVEKVYEAVPKKDCEVIPESINEINFPFILTDVIIDSTEKEINDCLRQIGHLGIRKIQKNRGSGVRSIFIHRLGFASDYQRNYDSNSCYDEVIRINYKDFIKLIPIKEGEKRKLSGWKTIRVGNKTALLKEQNPFITFAWLINEKACTDGLKAFNALYGKSARYTDIDKYLRENNSIKIDYAGMEQETIDLMGFHGWLEEHAVKLLVKEQEYKYSHEQIMDRRNWFKRTEGHIWFIVQGYCEGDNTYLIHDTMWVKRNSFNDYIISSSPRE